MCLKPVKMYRFVSPNTGEVVRSFKPVSASLPCFEIIDLPCGKCVECAESYSREWSFRIMHEAQKYEHSCCVTLTYNDDNLPLDLSVNNRDYQLFLKLLRKHYGKLRYFGCAEYGGKRFRPHYHIILFGVHFDDLVYWSKSKSGQDLFRSPFLERFWTKGYSYIGELSLATAKYCSKYLQKLAYDNIPELRCRKRPFTFMSTHPGIGGDYHACLETDKLYLCGSYVKTPRYYLKQAERDGYCLDELKFSRLRKASLLKPDFNSLVNRRLKAKKLLFEHRH